MALPSEFVTATVNKVYEELKCFPKLTPVINSLTIEEKVNLKGYIEVLVLRCAADILARS